MEQLFLNLLEVSLTTGAAAFFLWALSALCRKRYAAKWTYWAWLVLALRLLVPFSVTMPRPAVRVRVPDVAIRAVLPQRTPPAPLAQTIPHTPVELPSAPVQTPQTPQTPPAAAPMTLLGGLMLVWAAGACCCLGWQLFGYARFRRKALRWSLPLRDERTLRLLHALCDEKKLPCPQVRSSSAVCGPMAMGFFKPLVLLPESCRDEASLRLILAHELTHIKRGDVWYKLVLALDKAVHWFNPLVWLLAREACAGLELSCDDEVIRDAPMETRHRYSDTILTFAAGQKKEQTALTTDFNGGKRTLRARFQNILSTRKKRGGTAALVLTVVLLAGIGTLVACGVGSPSGSETQKEAPDTAEALRGEYFDFAAQYRLDYLPFFADGQATRDAAEYLYWAFAINLDDWGDDKGVMTKKYVEACVQQRFGVTELVHASLPRCWEFDGAQYTAVPTGIKELPLYALSSWSVDEQGVYTVTLRQCSSGASIPSEEERARIREAVVRDDLSELTVTATETFRFRKDAQGEPVFLAHTMTAQETLALFFSEEYAGVVAAEPQHTQPADVVAQLYHVKSREAMGEAGGWLLTIRRMTRAELDAYWPVRYQIGGARPFAVDETYVYVAETPTDVRFTPDTRAEYEALEAAVPEQLAVFTQKNNLTEFDLEGYHVWATVSGLYPDGEWVGFYEDTGAEMLGQKFYSPHRDKSAVLAALKTDSTATLERMMVRAAAFWYGLNTENDEVLRRVSTVRMQDALPAAKDAKLPSGAAWRGAEMRWARAVYEPEVLSAAELRFTVRIESEAAAATLTLLVEKDGVPRIDGIQLSDLNGQTIPLHDSELLFGGIPLGCTYEEALALAGEPVYHYDHSSDQTVKSFAKDGFLYGFYQSQKSGEEDVYYLRHVNVQDGVGEGQTVKEAVLRGIRIGDPIETVLQKFVAKEQIPAPLAPFRLYGEPASSLPAMRAQLEQVADTFFSLALFSETCSVRFNFSRAEQTLLWVEGYGPGM